MQWHDYPTALSGWGRLAGAKGSAGEIFKTVVTKFASTFNSVAGPNTVAQLRAEWEWTEDKRPYYNMWPSVVRPFTKIDLSKVKCTDIHLPLDALLIRLPKGHELNGARSIFVKEIPASRNELGTQAFLLSINTGDVEDRCQIPVHTINVISCIEGQSVADRLTVGRENPYCEDEIDHEMVDLCFKLVAAICLLGDNPDLIEQAPLEADRKRWEATHDLNLIQKAEKRGKREWNVGSFIEVAPGFRNPHFAIRWMGRGVHVEKKPFVRPIKGCLVKRQAIEDVPTGWLDDEEQNVP